MNTRIRFAPGVRRWTDSFFSVNGMWASLLTYHARTTQEQTVRALQRTLWPMYWAGVISYLVPRKSSGVRQSVAAAAYFRIPVRHGSVNACVVTPGRHLRIAPTANEQPGPELVTVVF